MLPLLFLHLLGCKNNAIHYEIGVPLHRGRGR